MKKTHVIRYGALALMSAALAGCGTSKYGNSNIDYKNTSFQAGGVNQDIYQPGQYVSPNSF
jgi:hypothetical protein